MYSVTFFPADAANSFNLAFSSSVQERTILALRKVSAGRFFPKAPLGLPAPALAPPQFFLSLFIIRTFQLCVQSTLLTVWPEE